MEAAQQFPGDGHGLVPQLSRDLALPHMPTDAPSTPARLDGRHHDYSAVAPAADFNGVLNDTGQQPVRADQESFHAMAPRHPGRLTVFDRPSDDTRVRSALGLRRAAAW